MTDSLGLDFGTTNTVATTVNADGRVEAIHFTHDNADFDAFRSVLCFSEAEGAGRRADITAGPWAIDKFVEQAGDCRFIQSFKTFAASPLFADTLIYNRRYRFEDLFASFLQQVRTHAGVDFPKRVVIGRPVSFAGAAPDEALARTRYEAALRKIGFEEIHHVYEPVAAAYYFAQRLNTDATILVADFGGGTTAMAAASLRAASWFRTKARSASTGSTLGLIICSFIGTASMTDERGANDMRSDCCRSGRVSS